MALIKCPECGHMISDKATRYPKCGTPSLIENDAQFQTNRNQQPIHQQPVYYGDGNRGNNNKWLYVVIALLLAAIAGGGYYFYDRNKQVEKEFFNRKDKAKERESFVKGELGIDAWIWKSNGLATCVDRPLDDDDRPVDINPW